MKTDEYLALDNSEQNRIVAREVMGWVMYHDEVVDGNFWAVPDLGEDQPFDYYVDEWHPVTDWNDMRLVIERMRENEWGWDIGSHVGKFAARIFPGNQDFIVHEVDTIPELPLAMAVAALKAVGFLED